MGHLGIGGSKWHVEIFYVRGFLIGPQRKSLIFISFYFMDKPKARAKQKLRAFAFWNSDYPGGRANIRGELNVSLSKRSEKSRISS